MPILPMERLLVVPIRSRARWSTVASWGQTWAPTANLNCTGAGAIVGVYAVEVSGAGLASRRCRHVGVRPTVDDSIKANLEVHLLDREIALYGASISR